MEYLADFGLFFAKFATVGAIIFGGVVLLIIVAARSKQGDAEQLQIKHLNEKYDTMSRLLKAAILTPKDFKKDRKIAQKAEKKRAKSDTDDTSRKRVYVCRFKGDVRATGVASLREEISAILTVAKPADEVVAVIESAGGTVHGYGLGASQLQRIRDRGIPLTAAIDKVAASGGYMMACVADRIIAAPFAIVGSIGVIAQLPNFHRLLKKHDIDYEEITAGRYKRTLTLFGENTEEDRAKFREEIEDAHALFKDFVSEHRPAVNVDEVATGEHWFGRRALDKQLIDEIRTSDDYLASLAADADVYEVTYTKKKHWYDRFLGSARALFEPL